MFKRADRLTGIYTTDNITTERVSPSPQGAECLQRHEGSRESSSWPSPSRALPPRWGGKA